MEIKILVNIPYLPKYINAILVKLLNSPSLYDLENRLLALCGYVLDAAAADCDFSLAVVENASTMASWREAQANPKQHWDLYELVEKLVDLKDFLRQLQHQHLIAVKRMISLTHGSGQILESDRTRSIRTLSQRLKRHQFSSPANLAPAPAT